MAEQTHESERVPCPGCEGRGRDMDTMLVCGQCHGMGRIRPIDEAIRAKREDKEFQARLLKHMEENAEALRKLKEQ